MIATRSPLPAATWRSTAFQQVLSMPSANHSNRSPPRSNSALLVLERERPAAHAQLCEVLDAKRTDLPDRTQQALDVVVSQVRRFDDMVIDLLELSRIDAGQQDLNPEPVDLVEMCDRVSQRYGYGDLPIEVHRRARRKASLDRVRFERILGNLLDNATNHGGGPTRIAIEPSSVRRCVEIAVEDAGPGVADGERTRIFERFARGSAARNRIGTGLGLALVAEHAQALGGDAWVEDRPGGGARFVVRLPTEEG